MPCINIFQNTQCTPSYRRRQPPPIRPPKTIVAHRDYHIKGHSQPLNARYWCDVPSDTSSALVRPLTPCPKSSTHHPLTLRPTPSPKVMVVYKFAPPRGREFIYHHHFDPSTSEANLLSGGCVCGWCVFAGFGKCAQGPRGGGTKRKGMGTKRATTWRTREGTPRNNGGNINNDNNNKHINNNFNTSNKHAKGKHP